MKRQIFAAQILPFALGGSFMLALQANALGNSRLTVTVDGLRNQKGQVCFNLFTKSQGFPSSNNLALKSRCISAKNTPVTVSFSDLRAGNYAVAVIHNETGDGVLRRGFLGIPKDGFGFSGNPTIRTGPPSFGDAAIFVAGQDTSIEIQLNYF